MHEDLAAGDALEDVVDLRLDGRLVVLSAALEHELCAEGGEARDAHDVLPDVLGQDLREAGEQFLLLVAFLLEVHAVRVEEDGAAIAELRSQLRRESGLGVLRDGQTELIGHGLQQHAVTGGALIAELERLDVAVLHEEDLDVLTADVTDHVDVAEVVTRAHHVGDGLDDVHVGAQALFEHVGRVARGAEAHDVEVRALGLDLLLQLGQELLHVADGVALGQTVGLEEQLAVFTYEHGLARGAAAVEADHGAHEVALVELGLVERGDAVARLEGRELVRVGSQRRARRLAEALLAPFVDVAVQGVEPGEATHVRSLVQAIDHGAEGRVEFGVLGQDDQLLDGHVLGVVVAALVPGLGDALAPALLQEGQVGVGSAEQQHLGAQRVAACEHSEVLHHDGVRQRAHDLVGGDARLHQVDDVRLGEDATLGGDVVQARVVEVEAGRELGRDAGLDHALVDGGAGAGRALVVHGRASGLVAVLSLLEDDDLRVLTAQLHHRAYVGVHGLDREGDGVDLLHELRAQGRREGTRAGAGHEHADALVSDIAEGLEDALEEVHGCLGLLRVMPRVVVPEDLMALGVDDDRLHGGRTHVQSDDDIPHLPAPRAGCPRR